MNSEFDFETLLGKLKDYVMNLDYEIFQYSVNRLLS